MADPNLTHAGVRLSMLWPNNEIIKLQLRLFLSAVYMLRV
jgi:hypothetical protein